MNRSIRASHTHCVIPWHAAFVGGVHSHWISCSILEFTHAYKLKMTASKTRVMCEQQRKKTGRLDVSLHDNKVIGHRFLSQFRVVVYMCHEPYEPITSHLSQIALNSHQTLFAIESRTILTQYLFSVEDKPLWLKCNIPVASLVLLISCIYRFCLLGDNSHCLQKEKFFKTT